MSDKPLVSVVMPAYNSEKFIAETIDSVLAQTYDNFEFIIVNDSSTDKTCDIVKEYIAKDKRIKLLNNLYAKGVSGASNTGLEAASGKYIAKIDSDDLCMPERFDKQVKFLEKNPDFGLVGSSALKFENGKVIEKMICPVEHEEIYKIMFHSNAIIHSTVMLRKELIDKYHIQYSDQLKIAHDYFMWCELLYKYKTKAYNFPDYLVRYRMHNTNTSRLKIDCVADEGLTVQLNTLKFMGFSSAGSEKVGKLRRRGKWLLSELVDLFDIINQDLENLNTTDYRIVAKFIAHNICKIIRHKDNKKNHEFYKWFAKNKLCAYLPFKRKVVIYLNSFLAIFKAGNK